jgi:UDPglucose--hexose-1-phosphate uridylyltransferase
MPEFRQNLATKEWVVVAVDRALKPEDLRQREPLPAAPEKDPGCPFCPGNEERTQPAAGTAAAVNGWTARAVANKVPVLVPNAPKVAPAGLYRRLPGAGVHEVVVESRRHDRRWSQYAPEEAEAVVAAYVERFRAISSDLKVALTLLFRNQGRSTGTELSHPHAQVVGSSVVPASVRHRMDEAQKHYDQNNECVFCRTVEEERAQGQRIVAENEHFVAFVLFASLSPFHLWILPKRHTPAFDKVTEAEQKSLAAILRLVLGKIDAGLGSPDYSFVIQSTPQDRGTTEAFHWYISLVVRSGRAAGFELGSGMYLNNVVPEDAARFLQAVKA